MLVVHPTDKTTDFLKCLYADKDIIRILDQRYSNSQINSALFHSSMYEQIMLLGHGSDKGLFSKSDDSKDGFDRIIIGHSHGYLLRRHNGHIVGIWCNADKFAQKERLHGLFSGMIVTEMTEADEYNIVTSQEELDIENNKLAERLKAILDSGLSLYEVSREIVGLDDVHSPLTTFNYNNFFYL